MGLWDGHKESQGEGHQKTQRERAIYRTKKHTRKAGSYTGTLGKESGNIGKTRLSAILLVFSVTPFKIDQNKNQDRSIDKVQNLGNERRQICKDSRRDSGHSNISYERYAEKFFTQI